MGRNNSEYDSRYDRSRGVTIRRGNAEMKTDHDSGLVIAACLGCAAVAAVCLGGPAVLATLAAGASKSLK